MLTLPNITRIYQREKAAILIMVSRGLAKEEIATFLDLSVAEVEATIAESQQN